MESQTAKALLPSNSTSRSTNVFLPFRRVRPRILYDFKRMPLSVNGGTSGNYVSLLRNLSFSMPEVTEKNVGKTIKMRVAESLNCGNHGMKGVTRGVFFI